MPLVTHFGTDGDSLNCTPALSFHLVSGWPQKVPKEFTHYFQLHTDLNSSYAINSVSPVEHSDSQLNSLQTQCYTTFILVLRV